MATPAERAELIKKGTAKSRRDFLAYSAEQEKAIYNLLQQSADNIAKRIAKAETMGKIPAARLKPLLDTIQAEMAALRPAIKGQIVRGMSNSVNLGMESAVKGMAGAGLKGGIKIEIGSAFIGKDGKVRKYDAKEEAFKDSKWGKINKNAMAALLKNPSAGITLSDRVWDLTWAAEKAMRAQLQMAVLQGDSAARLSRDIRGFLSQPLTLRGKVKAAYQPGTGVYKSAYQNAMRFARTEYNRAFNEGEFRYAADKDWVMGYVWRTGGANPCEDWAALDGTEYEKGNEPTIPLHPNCECWLELVTDESK
jgi:hypothetical protein